VVRRFTSALISVALCAAWIAGVVHRAQPHVYCERHHELEDQAPCAAPVAQAYAAIRSVPCCHGHMACGLVGQHPDRARPPVPPPPAPAETPTSTAPAADQIAVAPIRLLATAPKTSPPRAS
jgi:hypothetical protein